MARRASRTQSRRKSGIIPFFRVGGAPSSRKAPFPLLSRALLTLLVPPSLPLTLPSADLGSLIPILQARSLNIASAIIGVLAQHNSFCFRDVTVVTHEGNRPRPQLLLRRRWSPRRDRGWGRGQRRSPRSSRKMRSGIGKVCITITCSWCWCWCCCCCCCCCWYG